MASGMLDRLV